MNIIVQTTSFTATTGILIAGALRFDCTLGRAGAVLDKREGDGGTPIGTYPFRQLLYRADRVERPETGLEVEILDAATGWCEDPAHPDYNTKVRLPHPAITDCMMRDDHVYDYTAVIGYNDAPVVPGRGSAIFMHLAREAFTPTAGCVGLRAPDMLEVLKVLDKSSHITILPPAGG